MTGSRVAVSRPTWQCRVIQVGHAVVGQELIQHTWLITPEGGKRASLRRKPPLGFHFSREIFTGEKKRRFFFSLLLRTNTVINLISLCGATKEPTWGPEPSLRRQPVTKHKQNRPNRCSSLLFSRHLSWIDSTVTMLGAEGRLESRLKRLETLMRNPLSALNFETLLVSLESDPEVLYSETGRSELHAYFHIIILS